MGTRERLAVQRAVARDADQVTARVIGVVLREIPAYADVSPAQRDEIAAIATWALQRTVEMWVDESAMTEADLRRFRGIGAARATDGRPLPAILRAYRVAAVETADLVVELGDETLDVDDLAALNRTMLVGVDELSEALFAGYEEASAHLRQDRARVLAALAADLLAGRQTSRAALADRSARLGVTIPSRLVLTILPSGPRAAAGADGTAGTAGFALVHSARDHVVHLSEAPVALDVDGHAGRTGTPSRAVVLQGLTVAQLPRAYRLAAGAFERAPARAYRRSGILTLADVLLVAVLAGTDPEAGDDLPAAALGPLLDPAQTHLLEGLVGYLDHGSATEAATALGVHPQTVRHRLRRVRGLTGRDLDDPWDRLVLDAARTALQSRAAS
ncbi:PucR family transcriptional regulator [Mumia sp. DW29H23]|uniref:PucR family transcriptional regulator n=1 Tax=Mumia sp. DW29H23 TaxID=3421241 RepID=UPI003D69733D